MPHTRAAGVRVASGEETAGRIGSVVPRAMGIVALAVVARGVGLAGLGQREAVANRDGVLRRGTSMPRVYRHGRDERTPMGDLGEDLPCQSRTGKSGQPLGVVL